jgi:hypothetical protein
LTVTNDRSNKADHNENLEDYDTPPFTQRKCVCRIIPSDDDDPLASEMVMQDMKAVTDDREAAPAAKLKPTSHDMGRQTVSVKNRPKMADYPPQDRQVIGTAIEFYHALLLTENPFPEFREELDWVRDAFDASRIYHKLLHAELDPSKIKIVSIDLGGMLNAQYLLDHCTCFKPTGAIQIRSKVICCLVIQIPNRRWGSHQGEQPEAGNGAEVQVGICLPCKY